MRHDRDAGLEPGHAERQLGKHEERQGEHHHRAAVLGPWAASSRKIAGVLEYLPHTTDDDDRVEGEVHADQHDRQSHRLGEPAQEHRAEQRQQDHGDEDLMAVQHRLEVGVLDQVGGGVGRGECHGDDEVGRGEPEQDEDEDLALPERQQPLQHGDRPSPCGLSWATRR